MNSLKKAELINLVLQLEKKVDELSSYKFISNRVRALEVSQYELLQYNRKDSIEIDGIPADIENNEVENSALKV